jgi:hypothetical protein
MDSSESLCVCVCVCGCVFVCLHLTCAFVLRCLGVRGLLFSGRQSTCHLTWQNAIVLVVQCLAQSWEGLQAVISALQRPMWPGK